MVFVDSDRPNVAIVGFTVDPPGPATVRYWQHDGSPATIETPSSMSSVNLFGTTVQLANLDVLAATTYDFQAIAGSGISVGSSPVGQFTAGNGVEQFDVALSEATRRRSRSRTGSRPTCTSRRTPYAQPLVPLADLGGGGVRRPALVRRARVLRRHRHRGRRPRDVQRAEVTYALSGIDADSVVIRAFPTETATTEGGEVSLEGVLEAGGPAPSGEVGVGCLASGLTYHIVLDAIGDDRGILASEDVTVP